jgi:hypothetical protein
MIKNPDLNKIGIFFSLKQKSNSKRVALLVGLLGLEPRKTAPKTVVLPLHHRPKYFNAGANLYLFLFNTNIYTFFMKKKSAILPNYSISNS